MKNLILLLGVLAVLSCHSEKDARIDYELSWKGDGIGVAVTLTSPKDTVRFTYASEAGGMKDQMSWIQDFTVGRGEVLTDTAAFAKHFQ